MKQIIITIQFALVAMAGQAQEPFFRTDSAFIIGKVNGIAPQAMPKQIIVAWNNAMTNNMRDKTVDVSADGDFTCRMQLHHPGSWGAVLLIIFYVENLDVESWGVKNDV